MDAYEPPLQYVRRYLPLLMRHYVPLIRWPFLRRVDAHAFPPSFRNISRLPYRQSYGTRMSLSPNGDRIPSLNPG